MDKRRRSMFQRKSSKIFVQERGSTRVGPGWGKAMRAETLTPVSGRFGIAKLVAGETGGSWGRLSARGIASRDGSLRSAEALNLFDEGEPGNQLYRGRSSTD